MKIKNVLTTVVFSTVVLLTSCDRKEAYYYDFQEENVICIPIADSIKQNKILYIPRFQYCVVDGVETLISYIENNKLTFFDIEKRVPYYEISLLTDRPLCTFEYINKDSIFVLYDAPYSSYIPTRNCTNGSCPITELPFNATNDSLRFMLIDYDGNVKKYYHFNCDKSNFEGTNLTEEDVMPPHTFLDYGEICRSENMIFFLPRRYSQNDCDSIENSMPFIASYDLNTEKYYFTKLKLPYLNNKMYYPVLEGGHYKQVYFCMSPSGMPIIRFPYSADVFEWDYKNDVLIPHTLKSKLIDTIPPLQYKTDAAEAMVANYGFIDYDPDNCVYYSSIRINGLSKPFSSIIIADKDFNYIGESLNSSKHIPYNKGKRISCSIRQDTICINIYELKKKVESNYSIDSLRNAIDSLRNDKEHKISQYVIEGQNSLQNYFEQNVQNHDTSYCIVTLYTQAGCESCRLSILNLINANQKILSEVPLYLIITGSKSKISNELNDNDIIFEEFKNVIIDEEAIVTSFPVKSSFINPRLTIVRDNKVVLDSIYNSDDIGNSLIPTMLNACGLRMEVY